jgi:ADP-ribose pyrophosphatase YjhB (NUDIX family)
LADEKAGLARGAVMMPWAAATLLRMFEPRRIKHCRDCGAAARYQVPADDNRERATCSACNAIHYENPLNVVGTVPFIDDRVLLCLRNIEPRKGKWTLPAGFMELGETVAEGAQRETAEEAGADIELLDLFTLMNVVRVGQVHFFFRARLLSERFDPGHETQEVRLFREDEIPWDEIAFRTVRDTLRCFFADRARGQFDLHQIDIA